MPLQDMTAIRDHTLEMVKMADEAGFCDRLGRRTSRAGNDHRAEPFSDPHLVGR